MNVTTAIRLLLNLSLLYYKCKLWQNNNTKTIPIKTNSVLLVSSSACSIYSSGKDDDEDSLLPSELLVRVSIKKDAETNFVPSPFNKKKYILMGQEKLEIPENISMLEPTKDEFLRVADILENYEFSASTMSDDSLVNTVQLFLEFNASFILRMFYFRFAKDFKNLDPAIVAELEKFLDGVLGDAAY